MQNSTNLHKNLIANTPLESSAFNEKGLLGVKF